MLNFNSVRSLYPEMICKINVRVLPQEREATKKSKARQKAILRLVKNGGMGISELVNNVRCKREQMRYDVRTMIARGELINLSSGKSPYFVVAA